jgi:hypothetical protein
MIDAIYNEIGSLLKGRTGIVRPFTHHTLDGYANAENANFGNAVSTTQSKHRSKSSLSKAMTYG